MASKVHISILNLTTAKKKTSKRQFSRKNIIILVRSVLHGYITPQTDNYNRSRHTAWTCLVNSFSVLENHIEGVALWICRGIGPSTLRQVFARRIIWLRLIVRDQWTSPWGTHTWALVNSINHESIIPSIN